MRTTRNFVTSLVALAFPLAAACGSTTDGSGATATATANETTEPSPAGDDTNAREDRPNVFDAAAAAPTSTDAGIDHASDAASEPDPLLDACIGACAIATDATCHKHCVDGCTSGNCTLGPFEFSKVTQVTCRDSGTMPPKIIITFLSPSAQKKARACAGPPLAQ